MAKKNDFGLTYAQRKERIVSILTRFVNVLKSFLIFALVALVSLFFVFVFGALKVFLLYLMIWFGLMFIGIVGFLIAGYQMFKKLKMYDVDVDDLKKFYRKEVN